MTFAQCPSSDFYLRHLKTDNFTLHYIKPVTNAGSIFEVAAMWPDATITMATCNYYYLLLPSLGSHTTESSLQHAEQVQDVACGSNMPSSMRHCRVRPP